MDSGGLYVAEVAPLVGVDPLMAASAFGAPVAWLERPDEGTAIAGFGVAAQTTSALRCETARVIAPAPLPGPWLGGVGFDGSWKDFGAARWVLPEVLLWRGGIAAIA